MNKVTKTVLAAGLALAVATPALAEFKFSGFYRAIGYMEEKKAAANEGDSQQFIDQRFRAKLDYTLNDNVSVTYFAEIDTPWGEPGKAAYGQGGMSNSFAGGADGVNVETKNVSLNLKSGDTAAQLGIIGVADSFQSIVANDDMAAVKLVQSFGNTTFTGVYSKWDEDAATSTTSYTFKLDQTGDGLVTEADLADILTGLTSAQEAEVLAYLDGGPDPSAATIAALQKNGSITLDAATSYAKADGRSDWDDFDYWAAEVSHKFDDNFKAGAGLYLMDDNRVGDGKEVWFYGLNGEAKFGDLGVNAFVIMQDGSNDEGAKSYDYTGYAASAKATYKINNGDLGLRMIYFSEADDSSDDGRWQGFKGQYEFVAENQMQFLCDPFVMNDSKERYALNDAVGGGYGLMAAVLSGNHKLPSDMYFKWGVGYYMAADDTANVRGTTTKKEGDSLGYEVAARVGRTYFGKVDVSLNASYAGYGDFYDTAAGDPDDTYKTYLMVNVPF